MWPWGHAAVGYVLLTALSITYRGRPLSTKEAIIVVVGTQVPDLVDKPLSWTFGVLPAGRSLGHSLLVFALLSAIALVLARHCGRRNLIGLVFGGYLVGVASDVPPSALAGEYSRASFLLWPLRESPVYTTEPSFVAHVAELGIDDALQLVVIGTGLITVHLLLTLYTWREFPGDRESG